MGSGKSIRRVVLMLAVSAVLLAFCSMASFLFPIHNRVDQNCFFTVGRGMMTGLVPYRDLMEQKGPLLYFLHGLAYLISHDTFIGVYLIEIPFMTVYLLYSYHIARLYTGEWQAMVAALAVGTVTVTSHCFVRGDNAEEYCLPLLAVSLSHLLRFFRRQEEGDGKPPSLLLMGINGLLAGCVLWIKFTLLGFWLAWNLLLFIWLVRRGKAGRALLGAIIFGSGMVAMTLPWILYFAWHHALRDWFFGYIYSNIFLYPARMGLLERLGRLLGVTLLNGATNPLLAFLVGSGLWGIVRSPCFYAGKRERRAVSITFGALYLGLYIGGTGYDYYLLIAAPFALFGILYWLKRAGDALGRRREKHPRSSLAALAVGLTAFAVLGSNCLPFYGVPREEYAQYQFARIIRQTPGATLLNYGFLDGGFYLASGTTPLNKYFCRLNIPEGRLPAMAKAHDSLISRRVPDYVVARIDIRGRPEDIQSPELWRNYRIVARAVNVPDSYKYLLLERRREPLK